MEDWQRKLGIKKCAYCVVSLREKKKAPKHPPSEELLSIPITINSPSQSHVDDDSVASGVKFSHALPIDASIYLCLFLSSYLSVYCPVSCSVNRSIDQSINRSINIVLSYVFFPLALALALSLSLSLPKSYLYLFI